MIVEPKIGTPDEIGDPLSVYAIEDDIDLPARPRLSIKCHQSLIMRSGEIAFRVTYKSGCVSVRTTTVFTGGHLFDP
jgi:hypothetical protein